MGLILLKWKENQCKGMVSRAITLEGKSTREVSLLMHEAQRMETVAFIG